MHVSRIAFRPLLMIAAAISIAMITACGSADAEIAITDAAETASSTDNDDHADEDDDHADEDDDHDDEATSGGLDAHAHGTADLFVGWNGADVVVDLISPAINIFGFEYEPTTDEDVAVVADRTEALTTAGLLAFNSEAGCSLTDTESEFEVDGSHAEVETSWSFTCDDSDELRQLDLTSLFAEFPLLEDVDAQWASPTTQSAAELSSSSAILRFDQ